MKRSIFSFILLAAILICFFSSAVLAGGGKDSGDTHPWDMDGVVIDTLSDLTQTFSQVQDTKPFPWTTLSLSYSITVWVFFDEPVFQQTKQVEVIKKEINARGNYRTNKLLK